MKQSSTALLLHAIICAASLSLFPIGCAVGDLASGVVVADSAPEQTTKSVKGTLDASSLIGKSRSEVKTILGKPSEIGKDNCDNLPEWTFKRQNLKRFAVKFDGGKVSDVFATFKDLNASPDTCLTIMGLQKSDWEVDRSASSETQHSYKRGKLWASVNRLRDPDMLTIQIMKVP